MLWGIIIYLKMLSQVQGFSTWKALRNMLMSGLILAVLATAVYLALVRGLYGIIGFKM
jgi:succinate dehydrogenase/fumarate reductase cytochrome b subunit